MKAITPMPVKQGAPTEYHNITKHARMKIGELHPMCIIGANWRNCWASLEIRLLICPLDDVPNPIEESRVVFRKIAVTMTVRKRRAMRSDICWALAMQRDWISKHMQKQIGIATAI
mmetsp:Transcript_67586/g.121859  ORF Transcript_67586/g.121859 Transcript_67586/m.121859 type:complete len:116 (+) Transcript_67586:3441-3788(+)